MLIEVLHVLLYILQIITMHCTLNNSSRGRGSHHVSSYLCRVYSQTFLCAVFPQNVLTSLQIVFVTYLTPETSIILSRAKICKYKYLLFPVNISSLKLSQRLIWFAFLQRKTRFEYNINCFKDFLTVGPYYCRKYFYHKKNVEELSPGEH